MVKSGLKVVDDLNNLGHLNHFLEGQVGLIYKLNYLDVTQISLNFFIIIVWNQVVVSSCFEACAVSKDLIFKKSVQGTGSSNISCQEWRNLYSYVYGIVSYQNFFMSCYITFKKRNQHVGHKWVSGSQVGQWVTSKLFCGSMGQMGQQVWPAFNPGEMIMTYNIATVWSSWHWWIHIL